MLWVFSLKSLLYSISRQHCINPGRVDFWNSWDVGILQSMAGWSIHFIFIHYICAYALCICIHRHMRKYM